MLTIILHTVMLKLMKNITIKYKVLLKRVSAATAALLLLAACLGSTPKAFAMTFGQVVEYNMATSGSGNVEIEFKAGASDAAGTLTVAFGSAVSSVAATQTVTGGSGNCTTFFTNSPTGLPGTLTSSTGSGTTVTVNNVGALTSGTLYCFDLTSATAVTNTASAGNYNVILTDAADTDTVGIDVITTDTIGVTASVGQVFTLSGFSAAAIGSLSSTAVTASGAVSLSVTSNATNGWSLWAEDQYAALKSTSTSATIGSVPAGSNANMTTDIGSSDYALGVTNATYATTNYADAGGTTGGALSNTQFYQIATTGSTTSGASVPVKMLADIANTQTPASDYADTVTVVGDGSF